MSGLLDRAGASFAAATDEGGEEEVVLSANSVEKLSLVIMEFIYRILLLDVLSFLSWFMVIVSSYG